MSNGAGTAAIPAARSTRRSIRSTRTTSRSCASRGGGRRRSELARRSCRDFSFSHDFRATPLMIDGVLFSPNGIGLVEAFHPATGRTIWVQQPFADEPQRAARRQHARVAYWADGTIERLFVDPRRISRSRSIRAPARRSPTWGDGGRVNLKRGLGPRATTYLVEQRPAGVRRRRDGRRQHDRPPADQGAAAGQRAGVRRAHRASRAGPFTSSRGPAKSATRPGKTIRGRIRATRISGR